MPESLPSHSSQPRLGHTTYGHGQEKVLLLHDWMGDASNYEALIPHLNPHTYSYIFADLRGYGTSRHLTGSYSVEEVAADAFHLADELGWSQFHVVGHSMTGMVVQRMAIDERTAGVHRLKSLVAITPVSAAGYPADRETRQLLWDLIGRRDLSEHAFALLTGQRLSHAWARAKTQRHLQTADPQALRGYYRMWFETDFSSAARNASIDLPLLVVGGRRDLPGFQEAHLKQTFGSLYANAEFTFITDAGHYPMQETPVYLASLLERFLRAHS